MVDFLEEELLLGEEAGDPLLGLLAIGDILEEAMDPAKIGVGFAYGMHMAGLPLGGDQAVAEVEGLALFQGAPGSPAR